MLLAVLFGIVASVTFVLCQPKMDDLLHPKEDPTITIPKDEPEQETETEEPDTETETNEPDSEAQIVYEQLTLADFQTLQNEMYAIGKQANKFIVAVTGVKSNTDWFNNAYESKGQGSGIIIANSGQELLILTERKVIAGASSVYVTFVNDTSVEASIKKYDGNTGITVLSVPVDEIDNDTMNLISVAVLGNSLAITVSAIVLLLIFCSMAAWVLARYKTKMSSFIFLLYAAATLIPFQCVMLPLIRFMDGLNLMNRPGLVFMYLGLDRASLSFCCTVLSKCASGARGSGPHRRLQHGANLFPDRFSALENNSHHCGDSQCNVALERFSSASACHQ